ncbi:MAG: hypothetical protein AAGE84_14865 [Cyanobacteria bacterium P01_G01_bin.39]
MMSKSKKARQPLISVERLVDAYRKHPNMHQVEILKQQLKQEKLQDKIFYQSIKAKTHTCWQKV